MKRKPRLITYYITERCNATCVFCDIWKNKSPRDADAEIVKKILSESRRLFGPVFLDLTGGEPLLHNDVADLLSFAKVKGFRTSITTNTKCYETVSREIAGKVDFLLFSLDGTSDYHDGNRGKGTYDSVMRSIETARSLGEYPDIIMTVTDDNVGMISHVYDISRRAGLILQLNPVFSYFKAMPLSKEALDELDRMGKKPGIYLNRAQTAFMRNGGNKNDHPRCRGVSSNLVFNVDGEILLPCYHHCTSVVPAAGGLKEAFESKERKEAEMLQGKYPFCQGCTINCYFDPSYEFVYDILCMKSLGSRFKYGVERFIKRPLRHNLKNNRR